MIVRFLNTLKLIVRKGLKKSYYKVQENLYNKIKGKILAGQHLKQNVLKNRLTTTYCDYQEFGVNSVENRFLKKVLQFITRYVNNNGDVFKHNIGYIAEIIKYCNPSFELISNNIDSNEIKHIKHNPFFRESQEALEIGRLILKRFSYNISNTNSQQVFTPPFWIKTPLLFELYVYHKMLKNNSENDKKTIKFKFTTFGNEIDILVNKPDYQMIIDTKYKLKYLNGHIHQDIREVSGYGRLNKIREELNIHDDQTINTLIIWHCPEFCINRKRWD